jgi:hypothetical protein
MVIEEASPLRDDCRRVAPVTTVKNP